MAILKRRKVDTATSTAHHNYASVDDVIRHIAEPNVYPRDIRALIKRLGVSIRIEPMEQQKSGYLRRLGNGWVIGVNSLHHPRRQLFTLAHELGHYVLHRETVGEFEDATLFRAEGYGEWGVEKEANEFAADLLMPKDDFRACVRRYEGDVEQIARHFGVSALAVKIRANELRKIGR